jgi:hypothetical protein
MDAIGKLTEYLGTQGYRAEQPPVSATAFATKRGHSAGPFLPYVDYLFVHDLDVASRNELWVFEPMHEAAREYVDSQFKLPRPLRYTVPNIVSVGFSHRGFSDEMIGYAERYKGRDRPAGGEKHSVYLFDLCGGIMHSQGPEATPTRYGGSMVSTVNPTNRVYVLISEFARTLPRPARERVE